MKPLIIFHANCADGFTAAWVAWRYFKGACDLHPAVYGEQPPDCTGRDVYILDFSYSLKSMWEIIKVAESVVLLDHHESAMKALSGMSDHKLSVAFDMEKSGAMLAWEYFEYLSYKQAKADQRGSKTWMSVLDMEKVANDRILTAPKLIQYVQDRDLWSFKLPHSRAVNAYIFSYDYTIENWDHIAETLESDSMIGIATDIGLGIEQKHFKDIREFIKAASSTMIIGGHEVPVLNCPYHWGSDAAHIMSEGKPFAAYYYDKDGQRVFGLRSREDGVNVADIAKQYGGGGHAHAAGFIIRVGRVKELEVPNKEVIQ